MEVVCCINEQIDSWIWGLPMLVLLCGTHIFMTFRTGFIQRENLHWHSLVGDKGPGFAG